MRLTYKYEKSSGYGSVKLKNLPPDPLVDKIPYLDKAWEEQRNKLGQLEDIEEKLGIDLITIWKAKTNTFFFKNNLGKIYPVMFQTIDHITKIIHFTILDEKDIRNSCAFLKDYGKTWALTKEELS